MLVMSNGRAIIFDIEANGLNPDKIWCIVAKTLDDGEVYKWTPSTVQHFPAWCVDKDIKTFIGHYILLYDRPVLKKLLGMDIPLSDCIDTVVVSRVLDSARRKHSMEVLAVELLGKKKQEHDDWDNYSPEMLQRCITDVEINYDLYKRFVSDVKRKGTPKEVFTIEHKMASICGNIEAEGFTLKTKEAQLLLSELQQRKKELEGGLYDTFVSLPKFKKEVKPKIKKDGNLSSVGIKFIDGWEEKVAGEFSRIDWPPVNFNSQDFIVKHLMRMGWKPSVFTDKGNVRLPEWVLEEAAKKYPQAKILADWDLVDRRITQVQSWMDATDKDDKVHGSILHIGTRTTRASHFGPNLGQVPASDKPYGPQCRDLFTVSDPAKYNLLGTDASGIQLRVLAHYMNDKDYTHEVVNGDVHTKNQLAGGMTTRDMAKTFIYAFLLGAGNAKVGEIIEKDAQAGKITKQQFLERTPALKTMKYKYETLAKRGYIEAVDGRWIPVSDPYYTLSVLLQSVEAIVMKKATVLWTERAAHLDWKILTWVHDEWQTQVLIEHTEELAKIQVQAIIDAGEYYNLNCPMDGAFKIGKTWKETH